MKEWKRFTAFLLSLLIIVTSVDVSSLVSSASNSTVTSPNATITSPNTPEGEPEDSENLEGLGDLEDLGDSEETTYTYRVTDLLVTAQMELKWLTNLLPETVPAIPFTLYYQIDSGEELLFATVYADGGLEIAAGVKEALGLTEEQLAGIKLEKVTVGTGMDAYTVSGLPAAREVLSGENTEKTEKITYFWGGEDETLNQGYIIQKTDAGYSLIPVIEFTAKVGANVGYRDEYKPTESDVVESFKLQRVTGSGAIDCKFNADNTISVGENVDPYARWKLENGELVIEDLQEYSDQKELIDWQVSVDTISYTASKITDGSGDYFSAGYNNSKVPNYGSDRSTCHNGGTMYISLRGWTSFSANKIWLDEYTEADDDTKKAHRPVTDWALWRYSGKEGVDWNTSSPVRDDESSVITWSVDVTENSSSYTSVGYQNLSKGLPKYDSDGYQYVYFVRENMSGGDSYEQVFGVIVDENGNPTIVEEERADKKDRALYNGGTLLNRRTESKITTVKKTWDSAVYQDQLKDVYVELTLQTKASESADWEYTDIKTYLTGFSAERLTREKTIAIPAYDEFGKPHIFRWAETGVYEGNPETDKDLPNLFDAATGKTTLGENALANLQQGDYEYYVATDDGDTIVNKLYGETSYLIKKNWVGGLTPKEKENAYITWTLLRDGKVFEEKYTNVPMNKSTGWETAITGLPKYNQETGAEYEYIVIETECGLEGWSAAQPEYNELMTVYKGSENAITRQKNTVQLINRRTGGEIVEIQVRKQWIDDNDNGCRQPVVVDVVRNAYEDNPKTTVAENVRLEYQNNWWREIDVTEYRLMDGKIGTYDQWAEENPGKTPTRENLLTDATYSLIEKLPDGKGGYISAFEDIGLKTPSEEGCYIGTDNHVYYIDYADNGKRISELTDGYYDVINRRVGVINIAVEKTWIDGHGSSAVQGGVEAKTRAEYEAKLVLSCDGEEATISGNRVALHGENSPTGTAMDILTASGNKVSCEQNIGINLDKDGKEIVYFYNLPKYDKDGKVVKYKVEEIAKNASSGEDKNILEEKDYTVTITETYEAGNRHTNDRQEIKITNKRQDTKNVTFYKEWKDEARFASKERPDIYLTLYALSKSEGLQPTEYRNILWAEKPQMSRAVSDKVEMKFGNYNWSCTFTGLPEYNQYGETIYYFATENMHVNRDNLEYLDTQYKWEGTYMGEPLSLNFSSVVYDSKIDKYIAQTDMRDTDDLTRHYYIIDPSNPDNKISGVNEILLREGGTFVNQLQNTISIEGTKIWENIPGSFAVDDLPHLDIQVWRALETLVEKNEEKYYTENGLPKTENWDKAAWINDFVSTNLSTMFTIKYEGENTVSGNTVSGNAVRLKQYDDNGSRYVYVVTEVVKSPGAEVDGSIAGSYSSDPAVKGYQITNVYNPDDNKGVLDVKKIWGVFPDEWTGNSNDKIEYPELTFTLYWRYKKNNQEGETGTKYSELTKVDMEGVVSEKTLVYDENNHTVVFENLPIKAPNGSAYEYYVVEQRVGGYTQTTTSSPNVESEVVTELKGILGRNDITVSQLPAPRSAATQEGVVATTFGSIINRIKDVLGVERKDSKVSTVFKNTYNEQETFSIKGTKIWNDYQNKLNTRPESLTLEVYRKSHENDEQLLLTVSGNASTLSGNSVVENPDIFANTGELKVTWAEDENGHWTYTISGLDQYAENGKLWQYKVVEKTEKGGESLIGEYTAKKRETGYITAPTTYQKDKPKQLDDLIVKNLENDLYTTHTVKKQWNGINADIAKLPVTVKLQVKAGEHGTWTDAVNYFTDDKDIGDSIPWTQTMQIGSSYSYTWNNLPKGEQRDGKFVAYSYRAVETAVGEEEVIFNGTGDGQSYTNTGLFEITATTNEQTTTITNTLINNERVALQITKTWDDSDNKYNLRPVKEDDNKTWEVSFKIWREATVSGNTVTEKVQAEDGKSDLIVTISGNNISGSIAKEKTITVDDLPKQTLVSLEDGKTGWAEWSYYAEEVVPENSVLDTGYAQTVSGGNLPEKMFSSTTLNTLETINIQGKKVWKDEDNKALRPENVTLTLYVSDNGSTWKEASAYNSGFNGVKPNWDKRTGDNTWTWSYEGLPKTNASGQELQYKVVETTVPGYWKAEDSVAKANIADTQDTAAETKSIEFEDITNVLTEFTLDKVGDSAIDNGEITNVSLTFEGVADTPTEGWKLVWTRAQGVESYVISQNKIQKVKGTDNTGKPVVIKGLPVGAYKLTDEKVPNGYKTLEGTGYGFTLDANESITVTNKPQELSLKKTDLAGNELNGAVFTVTGKFRTTDTETTSDDAVREIGGTVEENQLKKGDLVAGEKYVLKETKAPTGYLVSDVEVTFKMNENGNAEIISPKTDSPATVSGNQIIFKDEPIELYLRKTKNLNAAGDEGNIDGAEFKLEEDVSGENSAEASWSVVSNKLTVSGGNLELNAATDYKLKTGTNYRLTEIKAADGYILNETPIYFKIASDGTFEDSTVETTDNTLIQTSMSGNELKVLNDPISITLLKSDGDKHTDDALTLGYADVAFTLTDQENEQSVQTKATDTSGKLTFGAEAGAHQFAVIGGKSYTLAETVPEGYKSVSDVTVSVAENGTITLSGNSIGKDEEQAISVSPDQKELTVTNRRIPGKVTVQKIDLYDGTGLEGAVFELLYKSVPGKESGTVAQTKTTDKDGMLVFENLEWGTYELVEKTAPEGYILDEKPIKIVITNKKREHSLIMGDGTAITNCKNSLEIYKNGQNTDEKLQAGFGLYFKKGQEWEKISLSEQLADTILLSGLRVGTYKLVEEIPPTGYRIPANAAEGELIFKMGEDGKVTTSETISSYYTVSNGTADQYGVYPNIITMKDDLTQAIIQKTDQDGNALTGAVFEVSGKFVSTPSGSTSSTITITDENRETALKGELIAGETYQIKEIDAPTGYKKPEDADVHFTLTVNLNGTYAVSSATGAVLNGTAIEVPDNVTDTVWIKDEPLNITLVKRDADFQKGDKETLENVTFTLQEKGVEDAAKIQTAVTDKDGELHLGLASKHGFDVYAGRTYILKETSAPAGYIVGLPEEGIELTVNANGTVAFTEIESVISGTDTSTVTVMNERETGTLILSKKDSHLTKDKSDDTALNGITFSLYRKQDGNWLDKFVNFITGKSYVMSDSFVWGQEETYPKGVKAEDGKIVITGLVWGDYKIVESKADGYVLDGSEFKFSIGPDSELKQYLEVSLGEIINDPNYVVVRKVDKTNNRRLAGAVFTLKDCNGKRVKDIQWSWNSDKGEGKAYRLAPGTYTLTETKAPDGYVKMQPVQFRMNADGTINLLDENELTVLMNGDTVGVILKNKRKLHKVEEETQTDGSDSSYAANTESAKTGDQAPIAGLLVVMGAAVIGFVSVKLFKRRKQK